MENKPDTGAFLLERRCIDATASPDKLSEQVEDRSQAVGKQKDKPWALRNQQPVGREYRWDGDRKPAQFCPRCQQRLHDRSRSSTRE